MKIFVHFMLNNKNALSIEYTAESDKDTVLSLTGKQGKVYQQWGGLCLETQQLPDAPNHSHFPSSVLRKGEVFTSKTVYAFGTV